MSAYILTPSGWRYLDSYSTWNPEVMRVLRATFGADRVRFYAMRSF